GAAFQFDGTNDQVWIAPRTNYDIGPSTNGFSLEFWMKPQIAQAGSVLGWTNGVRVERITTTSAGDGLRWYVTSTGNSFVDTTRIWGGSGWNWTHVALVYDRPTSTARVYTNGVFARSVNVGTNVFTTASNFYLGQNPSSTGFYTGLLD